jgi:hypothetical protein
MWIYTSTPPYVFIVQCLVTHMQLTVMKWNQLDEDSVLWRAPLNFLIGGKVLASLNDWQLLVTTH